MRDGAGVSFPVREMVSISGRSAGIEDIQALPEDQWTLLAETRGHLGLQDDEIWVRMRFCNTDHTSPICRVVEVPFARMDYLDWYVVYGDGKVRHARSGSMMRKPEGTMDTRYPSLAIRIQPGETVELYVRIVSETVIHTHFQVWDAETYVAAAQRREAGVALRMGALIALLLLAFFFVWGFREVGSIWFPLTFTFFGIGVANLAGFWPEASWISDTFRVKTLLMICSYWCVATVLLHARHFYELKKTRPVLARWTLRTAVVFFVVGGMSFLLPFHAGMVAGRVCVFIVFVMTIMIAVMMLTRCVSTWLNLAAHLVFFIYIFTHLAFDLGWTPFELRADTAGFIALSITMLLFILAQAWKVRELHAGYVVAVQDRQRERERRLTDQRIMLRDLHDGLGGIAATVSLMAAYGKRSPDPAIKNDRFEAIERMTCYASAEIRSLMNTLEHPAPFWADWLNDLRDYAASMLEASHIDFVWECRGHHPEKWPGFAPALSLTRVIKEAVYNAVKHAGAHRVLLRLVFRDDMLELLVRDDGRGGRHPTSSKGRGLSNMEKRVKELGGCISMDSSEDGTDIRIEMPVPRASLTVHEREKMGSYETE